MKKLYGLPVIISQPIKYPRFRLNWKWSTQELEDEFNGWLDDIFGVNYQNILQDGQIFKSSKTMLSPEHLIMTQKTYDSIIEAMK